MVLVEGIPFPPEITTTKPLALFGAGLTDIEVHFLQIKYNAIGVYLEEAVAEHLGNWKGKKWSELADDDGFFEALVSAPVEKYIRIVVIKEIKGSQYGVQLESGVRDRLAAVDKYEEEEEEALEKVTEFFQSKYFKTDSVITFHFPATPPTAEISFVTEGKGESKIKVENANVVEMIQKWYLGGTRAVSQSTVKSLAEKLAEKLTCFHKLSLVGSEMVLVEGIPFPPEITTTKPLALFGAGLTDIEVHFLQIKYNAIGVYLEEAVAEHLGNWKGKKWSELADDDGFFEALVSAPVEKYIRIVVIKEIKGSQYGVQLESGVRDRLAAVDKYEEEEEEALEKVTEFFQSKYFKTDSVITFHCPATPPTAEISFVTEGKGESKITVENANVVEMIQKWYLGGTRAVSQSTVKSLAEKLAEKLAA